MDLKQEIIRKPVIGLFALGIISLLGTALIWDFSATANNKEVPKPLDRPVKAMYLLKTAVTETRSFPGIVKAAAETELAFRVSGPLIEFNAQIGQRVEKGDLIARIDPRDFEINVKRLSAAVEEARANLKAMRAGARAEDIARIEADLNAARAHLIETKKKLSRNKKLIVHNAVSQAQLEHAQAENDMAKAKIDAMLQKLKKARSGARVEDIVAAEARIKILLSDLEAAKHALADTKLTAPFSGYINRKNVENYENVEDGESVVSLLDFSNVEVHTVIPEDLVIRSPDVTNIYCILDAYPGRRLEAVIKEVGRNIDSTNQSYPLTAILHLPEDIVVEPGMAATLSIDLRTPAHLCTGFILPTASVFADTDGRPCVWRIDPQTMRVITTKVKTGTLSGNSIHILSGLKAGDRVVTAGAKFLRDNQQIRILDMESEDRT